MEENRHGRTFCRAWPKAVGTVGKGVFFHAADLNLGVLAGTSAALLHSEDAGHRVLGKRDGISTKPALDCLSLDVTGRRTK